jgi:hypothetical protein
MVAQITLIKSAFVIFCFLHIMISQMDVPGALTPEECMDEMDLDTIRDKAWHIT